MQRKDIFATHSKNENLKRAILFTTFIFFLLKGNGQSCTTLGQTPSTAFPVCGTKTFAQQQVPICSSNTLYVPGCKNTSKTNYENKNPFYYKFTCFSSGTLGFLITPNDLKDDYDWQLYDVTGLDPNEIFTNKNIVVSGNWAGNPGTTGTTANGVNYIQCASDYNGKESRYARMPNIIEGHNYILLVSHFTDSQSGYSLSFSGGTANITDPKLPDLLSVTSSCDETKIFIKLNKKMKCSSLAPDGSDFTISTGITNIVSASASCRSGFDMDSLTLTLSKPLPPGDYTITIRNGIDGNTLVDNCDREIPVGNFLKLKITPLAPTPMDSLVPVKCAPQQLQLVFKKNMRCNSISADGKDFVVNGPWPVSVIKAEGANCVNGMSNIINVTLSAPVVHAGTYQLILKNGGDGSTIIDECGQETPAGSALSFTVKDTVSANFTYNILEGCKTDTVQLFHDAAHEVNQWFWRLDYNGTSSLQNPVSYFTTFGKKTIILKVSNGFCSDSLSKTIDLTNTLKAAFETENPLCPEDAATFMDKSIGKIVSYQWDFGNGTTDISKTPPPQRYPILIAEKIYPVQLVVENNNGCRDTVVQNLKVVKSCYIAVPNAFTPNGDGLNDFLYPVNAYKADHLEFKVFNRLGQLVFSTRNWMVKWDGTVKGRTPGCRNLCVDLEIHGSRHRQAGFHERINDADQIKMQHSQLLSHPFSFGECLYRLFRWYYPNWY